MSEEHETFPNAVEATLLIVALFAIEIAIAEVLLSFDYFARFESIGLWGLITVAGNGVLFSALLAYKKLRHRELFHSAQHSVASTLGLLAVPIVLLVPGLTLVASTINTIVLKAFPMTPDEQARFAALASDTPATVLVTCLLAPCLEEMLFRGIILRSFLRQYSRTAAILGSSVLFGIAHLNVYQFVTAFIAGLVLGWLYERTRSLWPCILLHAANNTFITYAYALVPTDADTFTPGFYLTAYALAIISGLLLLRVLMPARAQ
jgi:membrane protease YdiL (CAAX protease family)